MEIETTDKNAPAKRNEIQNDLSEMYMNEQIIGTCNCEKTASGLLERNITKANRLLSNIDPKKKIKFTFYDSKDESPEKNGPDLALLFIIKKNETTRKYPKAESDFEPGQDPIMTITVDGKHNTANSKFSDELALIKELSEDCSWGQYKKDLDLIYELQNHCIMRLDPTLLPWKKNVTSKGLDIDGILKDTDEEYE